MIAPRLKLRSNNNDRESGLTFHEKWLDYCLTTTKALATNDLS
jgi:hypothetical protein